jgi:endonuclease YncB( thermonuclease family)
MRLRHSGSRKAPWTGAFFVLLCWQQPALAGACAAPAGGEAVQVRYVYDGDTLVLANDRKIRLIGINTPEAGQDGQPPQALAIEARDRLRRLLFAQGNAARAVYGQEDRDRHGRYLANLWLADGKNLSAELLREGLGWAVAIPPNTRFLDCYLESEQSARAAAKGVWGHPDYAVRSSAQLNLRSKGFQLVEGRVVRINHGGGAIWVNLEGRFAVRIPDQDLRWFSHPPDSSWTGKQVQVRGWLYAVKGELRVTVRHPAALEVLSKDRADLKPAHNP